MNESPEMQTVQFKYPDVFSESGELERVGKEFGVETSVLEYQAQNGELVSLEPDMWRSLENSDSTQIEKGAWEQVAELSEQTNRDWEHLKNIIESGKAIQAPIIMKFGERYHLVAGNTRLMASKAMGITPKVLLFEIHTDS